MTTDEVATLMKGLLAENRQQTAVEKDDATVNAVTRPAPLIDEFQTHQHQIPGHGDWSISAIAQCVMARSRSTLTPGASFRFSLRFRIRRFLQPRPQAVPTARGY